MGAVTAPDGHFGDDPLRLIFAVCHPALSAGDRAVLMLRRLGGLTPAEIARGIRVPERAVASRAAQAERVLSEARVPFGVPVGAERAARLSSVLEAIYLIFNAGRIAATAGGTARPDLCGEALRLARLLGWLAPGEPEVLGFVALIHLQAARLPARTGPGGELVPLLDQDRSRWSRPLIRRGLAALGRAAALGGTPGPYALLGAIAACHARAASAADADWVRIVTLYEALSTLTPSPLVELNRAVALAMAYGPAAGLALADALAAEPALHDNHLLPSLRGDLLAKLGELDTARREFERAAALARDSQERAVLLSRASACGRSPG
jgi:predicted RNA polymerase sigma factor